MKITTLITALLTGLLLTITGCGGGGGGASPVNQAPTKAIVKLATSGTLSAGTLIGGIDTTINYPTNKGLSITGSDVVASGVAAGATAVTNLTIPGQARLININLSGAGFSAGEFVTFSFNIAPGNTPVASDFNVVPGATILDTNINPLNGLSVVIQSVTFQ